jgi:hypothetical protein
VASSNLRLRQGSLPELPRGVDTGRAAGGEPRSLDDDVAAAYSEDLADKWAAKTSDGLDRVVDMILGGIGRSSLQQPRAQSTDGDAGESAANPLPSVVSSKWIAQEARFRALSSETCGVWQREVGSSEITWQVFPTEKGTKRDSQSFKAEAMIADDLLRITLRLDTEAFRVAFGATAVDRWLNVARALGVDPASDMQLNGRNGGVVTRGGTAEDVARMSAIACAYLAGGARPTYTRATVDAPPGRDTTESPEDD